MVDCVLGARILLTETVHPETRGSVEQRGLCRLQVGPKVLCRSMPHELHMTSSKLRGVFLARLQGKIASLVEASFCIVLSLFEAQQLSSSNALILMIATESRSLGARTSGHEKAEDAPERHGIA